MITGLYNHSIDAKNRIIIPSKVKDQLGSSFTIVPGIDGCLKMYSKEEWDKYDEIMRGIPQTENAILRRFVYMNALEVQADSQGRVMLSQAMLQFAHISKNVVTVGCGVYAEIWAQEVWDERNLGAVPENLREMFIELGL